MIKSKKHVSIKGQRIILKGKATNGSINSLTDRNKIWKPKRFEYLVNKKGCFYYVRIYKGTGIGQVRLILHNNNHELIVAAMWSVIPDKTSYYLIEEIDPKINICL